MYYAYILQSKVNQSHYYGHSSDLETRVKRHNSGKVRSTKAFKPWELIYTEKFHTKAEAYKREQFFKSIDGYIYLKSIGIIWCINEIHLFKLKAVNSSFIFFWRDGRVVECGGLAPKGSLREKPLRRKSPGWFFNILFKKSCITHIFYKVKSINLITTDTVVIWKPGWNDITAEK